MIMVLAGTQDGREIITALTEAGLDVVASVTSEYGRRLVEANDIEIQSEALDAADLEHFIRKRSIKLVIDATHPYAVEISQNAEKACASAHVPCIRYERPESPMPEYEKLHLVPDMNAAARLAGELGKIIFLTTGSHTLKTFQTVLGARSDLRIIVRVLPQPEVLAECLLLGFKVENIVAMQGPFSQDLNHALFKEFESEVMITKNSGMIGGVDAKIDAAIELGIHVIVVQRPVMRYSRVFTSIEELVEHVKGRV